MAPSASARKTNFSANVTQRFDFEFTSAFRVHKLYKKGKQQKMLLVPEIDLFPTSLIRSSKRSAHLHLYRTGYSECYLEIQIKQAYVVSTRSNDTRILFARFQLPESKDTPLELNLARIYIDFPVLDDAFRFLDGFY